MSEITSINRRHFLKLGGVLAVGLGLPQWAKGHTLTKLTADNFVSLEINPYILITSDNKITLFNPKPDMGQGTTQSMPMLIAEELEVRLEDITVKPTSGAKKHGGQWVGGSSSVRTRWQSLREVGAAAREMLTKAAAQRWNVEESACYAENGRIFNKNNQQSFSYGELADDAAKFEVPQKPRLKAAKDFKLISKSLPRLDVPLRVTGKAQFGIDARVDGMLYAVVLHSPVIHGTITQIDDSAALKTPGVVKVFKTQRIMPHKKVDCVAVVATNTWAAIQGRKALKVTWDNGAFDKASTEQYFAELHSLAKTEGVTHKDAVGDVAKGLSQATKTLEAVYETPFTAHAPIEPETATAWVQGDTVEVWASVQSPEAVIDAVSRNHGFKPENIKVNVLLMGGSFGRKSYMDFVNEAVAIAKEVKAPVKLTWTREDDLTQGPVRPGMLNVLRGGLDAENKLVAWEHKFVGALLGWQLFKSPPTQGASWAEGCTQEDSPYAIPNRAQKFCLAETDVPILWWRSVYTSTNAFGHECFMDEMAHAAGQDPLQYRLDLLKDSPRFVKVLTLLKEKAGYQATSNGNKAMGIAITRSFSSIMAYAVTVSKAGAGVKIDTIVGVIDCGIAVNPDNVKAQTEGNIVMGLSAALKAPITMVNGEIQETNYHLFNPLRIDEVPPMDIHIVPSEEAPTGVGEPGLPPLAPALCNAIFNLTGKRIRKLPFDLATLA